MHLVQPFLMQGFPQIRRRKHRDIYNNYNNPNSVLYL